MTTAYDFMQNREISWLRFNLRVLEEAGDLSVAILERLKFISIFTTNLDEFFMVRVGSIRDLMLLKRDTIDVRTGWTPEEQLDAIYALMPKLYKTRDRLYRLNIEALREFGINNKHMETLTPAQLRYVREYYDQKVGPLLSPQIISSSRPLPFLENKKLYIILKLEDKNSGFVFGLVPISPDFEIYLSLPGDLLDYIRLERVILAHTDKMFPGKKILAQNIISVTRNFDVSETADFAEEFEDYKDQMKRILKRRQRKEIVRLEIYGDKDDDIHNYLLEELQISPQCVVYTNAPINLSYVYKLGDMLPSVLAEAVSYKKFKPRKRHLPEGQTMMSLIEQKDLFFSYPYDDIENFLDLLKEAAESKQVISIKITIYRLASHSKLVEYLIKAAENGVDVTVLVELKARFDEENNINYSDQLFAAGCTILYGFEAYKTHSKLCLITYKDDRDNIKFITQIGTGNYNEQTAKGYTDISLITANREIGMDANDFFRNMQTGNVQGKYLHLLQSPSTLKPRFLRLIDEEIMKGSDGYVRIKMNSLTDIDFIRKFQEASESGVKIDLIVRGICCILPGIEGLTENITVRSIVGRFLEHARIYQFGKGDQLKVYIASADLMTRNTERRVEIAAPVYDPVIREKLLKYMDIQMQDNTKARLMTSKGRYKKIDDGKPPFDAQQYFIEESEKESEKDYQNRKKEARWKGWFKRFLKR